MRETRCPGMRAVDGRTPAGVLCEGCCVSAGCTGTVEGCSCRISCVVMSSE